MATPILPAGIETISRPDAIALGINVFFTGEPCARGHISVRYVRNSNCYECRKLLRNNKALKRRLGEEMFAAFNAAEKKKSAAWREVNREKALAAGREWREKNKERAATLIREWFARNEGKRREYKQNRRSRKKENGGTLSSGIVQKLFKAQRGRCACCGAPLGANYHLDHIQPLALGGSNSDENVQLLTQRCNMQKGKKDPIEFMQQRGFLL